MNSLLKMKRRMLIEFIAFVIVFIALIVRVFYLQIVDGNRLKSLAEEQLNQERAIGAKRGTIYDATGENILAISSSVESVTVNPKVIDQKNKEKIAKGLANILDLDYDKVLEKVSKNSRIENIKKRIEKEEANNLRKWLIDNNIKVGVNIDEDSKRYYPYSSLASHVIGFCGSDNQGLNGIEAKYDSILKGIDGNIEKQVDASGKSFKENEEKYIESKDGNDLVLTIDATIQSIAEKHLEEACIDNKCTNGGNVIAMNPKNGDVLALASYPEYNLNKPFEIDVDKSSYEIEQNKGKYLNEMWRNKAISDTYEPGSTFKLVTASAALEEKLTDTDNEGEFNCSGGIEIAGVRIKCWRYYRPHGSESLREALMNSCNPVFIGLGQRIGVNKYYSFLKKFGLLKKTGIDLPGEASSIFLKEDKVGPIELATISFGQRFEVTPIQMITMLATIANKGEYIKPRIVKQIIDSDTKEKKNIEIEKGEQVISEESSKKILSMMNSVVSEGTGKNAKVEGYEIGGKTGTSEDGVNTGKYVSSFVGVANTDNPEIVLIVILYNPTGEGGHQGGGVAAPVAGKIFSEVLPYLNINNNDIKKKKVVMPNITGLKISEAKELLKEYGLKIKNINEDTNKIIYKQIPEKGVKLDEEEEVIIYTK